MIGHTWYVTLRHIYTLWRQPWFLGITLVQPAVWLVLFGQLFHRVAEIPGFNAGSYVTFLAPGVVAMSALASNGWSGMAFVDDVERGVLDRLLASPVHRGALIAGSMVYQALLTALQSAAIFLLAWVMGAQFAGGLPGVGVTLLASVLLGSAMAAVSNALGLLARQREPLIGVNNFVVLPATLLSPAFMPSELAPGWIQTVAQYNPVAWALAASREALASAADWQPILIHVTLLALLAAVCGLLATRAFRAYQRSL